LGGGTATLESKKQTIMASVESNAKNYLEQLEREGNDSEKSSGEQANPRFIKQSKNAEKHDENLN